MHMHFTEGYRSCKACGAKFACRLQTKGACHSVPSIAGAVFHAAQGAHIDEKVCMPQENMVHVFSCASTLHEKADKLCMFVCFGKEDAFVSICGCSCHACDKTKLQYGVYQMSNLLQTTLECTRHV